LLGCLARALLEHYRFKDLFIRRSKKVFVSFVPENTVREVKDSIPLTKDAIQNRIKRAGMKSRFGDLREYWATTMTQTLRQPEIDFLQGRISTSVFMRHYFNPAWITDLKARTLRTCEEILGQI
jgi:intergrase/recombinase